MPTAREEELLTIIMNLEKEVKKLRGLEDEVRRLRDIEEIKTLQKAYGYYLEHWMSQEVIDLFADGNDVTLTLAAGTYLGKEGVKKYFNHTVATPEFIHQVMQLSGIVTVDPDGKTAKGRWYGWGSVARPVQKSIRQHFFNGIYECEYIKEGGVWKIQKMKFDQIYKASPKEGWVKPELVAPFDPSIYQTPPNIKADIPRTVFPSYPSGYITPFSFNHPVTGRKTTEELKNSSLKGTKGN
jgi:hypothetical protein